MIHSVFEIPNEHSHCFIDVGYGLKDVSLRYTAMSLVEILAVGLTAHMAWVHGYGNRFFCSLCNL